MGEILIAGMASMLITIFLGPKFIEYLRVREFGQHIREDGPQEHHAKAGTPTMGGLIIFAAICVPYLVLSERDASSLAVFGVALGCAALGFADDYIKIIKRRSLGLSGWDVGVHGGMQFYPEKGDQILLKNYYLPGQLEQRLAEFVDYYNLRRYHQSLNNLPPADVFFGRGQTILTRRQNIKLKTFELRRRLHHASAA